MKLLPQFAKPRVWLIGLWLISTQLFATELTTPLSLKDAVANAWAKQPSLAAALQRRAEFSARQGNATNLLKGPPAITFENWTDRFTARAGFIKYATELSLPLWLPNEKAANLDQINGELQYFEALLSAMQLKVASEVREAYWANKLAEADVLNAQNQLKEFNQFADDLNRRLNAGLVSRFDTQLAMSQVQQASAELVNAQTEASTRRAEFERLTNVNFANLLQTRETPQAFETEYGFIAKHPTLIAAASGLTVTQQQLRLTQITTRETPEVGIGMFRERSSFGSGFENILTVRLRVPFSSSNKNAGRFAAAKANVDEAQASLHLETEQVTSKVAIARAELKSKESVETLTQKRLALASDNLKLATKAYELGQIDLPSRLKAQNEFFAADLVLKRTGIESARAISRLNQALGILP